MIRTLIQKMLGKTQHQPTASQLGTETENLFALGFEDREMLALTMLGMCADAQGGFVSGQDMLASAYLWSAESGEVLPIAKYLYATVTGQGGE